mmetsp:Transcript_25972/g.46150  ORF Transcript_25972/g.46150 Transcript_25972/m.46150 type:complete len:171 (-) Transcript_25972:289-801(-)|eukprot:CAMPEP_0197527128 /NCGR_PEP_ID=MMETSP1318-20131121/20436_1 /TAXON_ID=552666 /ORGANISM="Partenskyella glossopodia, Strain RCC365" /LENGTH=170 /DNA_ID=CAMNT_0043081617 /DNA_START=126 /DNA_END=638 /DNA_ORIENTATION=+
MADEELPPYQVKWALAENAESSLDPSKKGEAAASFPNGDQYKGSYSNGKRNGFGEYKWASTKKSEDDDEEKPGSTYKGGYKHGKKEGQGLAKFEDGGEYKGAWKNDEKSGLGAYYYPNGDSYIGHWKGDVKHGEGTYTFKTCKSIFTGQWAEGKMVKGTWKLHDQSTIQI